MTNLIIGVLVLFSFVLGIWAYPQLPAMVAGHWNAAGVVDGYLPKFWGVFFLPVILLGLWALFTLLPNIDPLKENVVAFRKDYNIVVLMILLVLVSLFKFTLLWNLGYHFPITLIVLGLLNVLFIGIGLVLPRMKQNYFMGIRTPWTIASEKVWEQTHQRGSKLFIAAGVIGLISLLGGSVVAVWVTTVAIVLAALGSVIDSYLTFRRLRASE